MSKVQFLRIGVVALVLAAVQTAGLDRFVLFGVAHLALPVYLAVAVGLRLPFSNAAIAGAVVGGAWDLLTDDLFGRYALGCAAAAGVASLLLFQSKRSWRVVRLRRMLASGVAIVTLAVLSAAVGETLPPVGLQSALGVVISAAVGGAVSGRALRRLALPGHTVWDPAPVRSTEWMDRRAGIYSITAPVVDREAA